MDVIEAIKARRNVTKYRPTPVPEQKIQTIFNAARLAPSADDMQPWKFVLVTDEDLKRQIANACKNQKWIAEAPVVVVALAMLDQSSAMVGGYMSSYPIDLAFAMDHLMLVAAREGLATCYVNAFDEEEVRALLGAPPDARVVGITPLGFPDETPPPRGSKHFSEIVSYNKFE